VRLSRTLHFTYDWTSYRLGRLETDRGMIQLSCDPRPEYGNASSKLRRPSHFGCARQWAGIIPRIRIRVRCYNPRKASKRQTECGMGVKGMDPWLVVTSEQQFFSRKLWQKKQFGPFLILYPGFGAFLLKENIYIAGYLDDVLDNKIRWGEGWKVGGKKLV
jgi:hypothetical protein